MRVAFDDQIFQAQGRGGASKYFTELIRRLPQHGVEPIVLSTSSHNLHLVEAGLAPPARPRGRVSSRIEWASWRALGRPDSRPRPEPDYDVLHHTFTQGSYLRRGYGPRVVTVLDMTPEIYPQYFRMGNPHLSKRLYCERADAIISISQNTAEDMYRFYGDHLRQKTTVIPFGIGKEFLAPAGRATLQLPDEYLLFVGVRSGYKDFATALDAFALVSKSMPALHLVIAGGGALTRNERQRLEELRLSSRVHHVAPMDLQMPELFQRAAAFVFPSRYEGFGLPTLEALACGTPAILADASCSREVGGSAATYFASGDAEALASCVTTALSADVRRQIAVSGPAHARRFRWEEAVDATKSVYASLGRPVRRS